MKNIKKVIFIISDTHRAKNVGLYGAKPTPTPQIDKLGKKGIVFLNAYTTITKSDPSITAMMTGRYPMSTGLVSHGKWIIKDQEKKLQKIPFLAEILQKNGFTTAAIDYFSRWHKRGFSYYSGKLVKDVSEKKIAGKNLPFLEYLRTFDGLSWRIVGRDFFVRFYYCFFPKVIIPYDPADVMIDDAISVLKKNKNKKLFLYLHFRDAHSPYVRPKGFRSYLFDSVEDRYNAAIHFMDEHIGRLIKHLEETGEIKDTLIIFTADHGESLTEHNIYIAHHDPYEVVVKIPLVFYNPSLKSKKINSFVQNIDIFPTILSLLKIPLPKGIDGINLLPAFKNSSPRLREHIFFDDNFFGKYRIWKSRRMIGIRYKNYKYIQTHEGEESDLFSRIPQNTRVTKEELYNIQKDPGEKNNLISEKSTLLQNLRHRLKKQVDLLEKKGITVSYR